MFTRPIFFLEGSGYKTNKCIEEARQATSILHLQVTQKATEGNQEMHCCAQNTAVVHYLFFSKLFNKNTVLPLSSNYIKFYVELNPSKKLVWRIKIHTCKESIL